MKKLFLIIILYCQLLLTSFAQNYMQADYFTYNDQAVIDSFVSQNHINRYIVYQTMLESDSIVYEEDEQKIVSFLIWADQKSSFIKLITIAQIFYARKINNDNVVNYKYFEYLWASDKENNLIFIPPVLSPFNSDIVLYVNNGKKYFFEYGETHYYTEDAAKSELRKEFLNIIKKCIKDNLGIFEKEKVYVR